MDGNYDLKIGQMWQVFYARNKQRSYSLRECLQGRSVQSCSANRSVAHQPPAIVEFAPVPCVILPPAIVEFEPRPPCVIEPAVDELLPRPGCVWLEPVLEELFALSRSKDRVRCICWRKSKEHGLLTNQLPWRRPGQWLLLSWRPGQWLWLPWQGRMWTKSSWTSSCFLVSLVFINYRSNGCCKRY